MASRANTFSALLESSILIHSSHWHTSRQVVCSRCVKITFSIYTSFTIEVCLHLSYFICFLYYCIIVKVTFASLRNFYEISWLPFMCDIYSLIHSLIYSYFIAYIFNGHTYIFIFYLFLDIYKMKSLFRSVTIGPS